jgi:hypothetical protein
MGIRDSDVSILRPVKRRFLHHQNNRFELISTFYLTLFNSVDKQTTSVRNYGGGVWDHEQLLPNSYLPL